MDTNDPYNSSLNVSSTLPPPVPPRRPRASIVEEEDDTPPVLPPRLVEQPATPPAISTALDTSSSTPFTPFASSPLSHEASNATNELTRRKKQSATSIVADLVPDLHGITPSQGLSTELYSHDAGLTRQAITEADKKSIPPSAIPGAFYPSTGKMPSWYRTGWASLTSNHAETSSGPLHDLVSRYKKSLKHDPLDDMIPSFLYGKWYHNGAALFVTAITSFVLAKLNAGLGSILLFCLFIGNIYIYIKESGN
ncbi:MAG: hypothetical protein EXX96DRAFT_13845 [Benjaminiella poitrasii]|nr:MAG: hypothetical protein EXX96DRAFT_13845 [Benjaminiella poitrasii]